MRFEKKKKHPLINVPYEIQQEILKRVVPVKSLIRFRSVSKQWKSLIDNPEFITHHTLNMQTQPHHLLVRYKVDSEYKYVSVVDDDSFPHNMFYHTVPPIFGQVKKDSMIGCSHGLVCFHIYNESNPIKTSHLVIWNPSVRKYVCIKFPKATSAFGFGFGVCSKTGDPKIVKISKDWKAGVFSLSSMTWRSVSLNVPRRGSWLSYNQVVIDGVVYWNVWTVNGFYVISFDLTSEEFGELELPDRPVSGYEFTSISKLNECLVVLYYCTPVAGIRDCDAWKMFKNGASKYSFTKLFTFDVQGSHGSKWDIIVGFRKNGQPIIERKFFTVVDDQALQGLTRYVINGVRMNGQPIIQRYDESVLEVYDKQGSAEGCTSFGIRGSHFWMASYMESLLLLKHSDSIIE